MLVRLSLLCFGIMTGFFYAYSVTVMPGLDDAPPDAAIEGMKGINRVVRNPVFFACFFGAAVLPLGAAIVAFLTGERITAALIGGAGGLYLFGVVVLTARMNVPMNDALSVVATPAAPGTWSEYSVEWTFWNHVRTAVSLICLAISAEALRRR